MAKEPVIPSVFFTDLDCIFDTRMGTLLRLNPEIVTSVIKAGYFERDRDIFPSTPPERFEALYKARDKATLKASMITPILSYAKDFCKQTYKGNIETPFVREPRFRINFHPYQLEEAEKELILKAIRIKIGPLPKIESVDMSYDEITPNYLKNDVSVIAIYDPYEWLEIHSVSNRLRKESCPAVMMIGPLRLRNLEDREIKMEEFRFNMELLAKPFVDLSLAMPRLFSADISPIINQKKNSKTT